MDEALQIFVDESRELLLEMEAALLVFERGGGDADTINSVFRAAHTIKGSSGLFGLDTIVAFVHVLETALDRVRSGSVAMDRDFAALLQKCADHIGELIAPVASGADGEGAQLDARSRELSALLQDKAGAVAAMKGSAPSVSGATPSGRSVFVGKRAATQCWHLSVRFSPCVLKDGMDPLSMIRYLSTFAKIAGVQIVESAAPAASTFDPETCHLGFELALETEAEAGQIEDAFEFVRQDCTLRLLPPRSALSAYADLIRERGEPELGELLVNCGTLTRDELSVCENPHADAPASSAVTGDLPAADQLSPSTPQAKAADSGLKLTKAADARSIRVDAHKLDELITLVGELIIASAGANLEASRTRNAELQESTSRLSDLVEQVRDHALQLRMVKIGATFSRFHRVVNDVSRATGKDIELLISGEDTELDKTVIESIADPLTHLVRNSVDHGIEAAELRLSRGKSAQGAVRLNAYHDSGSVVIEVSDDGGGLNRDRILAKALERGLIDAGRALTDSEVNALIFEPGFSTAEQVTNLSGRGVGMDVVKRNITALRGSIQIESTEGVGTKVMVRLPLTLAMINGFLVRLGKSVFVIPLEMIEECIEFAAEAKHDYTNLRGAALPFIRLREVLRIGGEIARRENIVVVNCAGQKAGLVVDELLGEFQTVIKPLGRMFNAVKCVSGSTILGNGDVALILDIPALVQSTVSLNATAHRALAVVEAA